MKGLEEEERPSLPVLPPEHCTALNVAPDRAEEPILCDVSFPDKLALASCGDAAINSH